MTWVRRKRAGSEGFATVATLALALVLIAVSALVATLGAVAVARHRASAAADLAALAGASHALEGEAAACKAARRVATAQGGVLMSCRLEGSDALVEVSITPAGRLGQLGTARAVARAGRSRG